MRVLFLLLLFVAGVISCSKNNSSDKKNDWTVSCEGAIDSGIACRELRETNKAFSGKPTISCNQTFVVNNGYTVSLLEYDAKEVREVRWFLPRVWPSQPPGIVHQASYLCHADMLIAAANYRYMVNFGNGEVWSYRDPNISQPVNMLPYKGGILSESTLLHRGEPAAGMEESFPRSVRIDEKTGKKFSVFNWLSHFDIVNLKLIRNYQFPNYCDLKPNPKGSIFFSDGCPHFDRIDLDKDIRYPSKSSTKEVVYWNDGVRNSWVSTYQDKVFRLIFSNSFQYPRDKPVYIEPHYYSYSTNTLYLHSNSTPVEVVQFNQELDTQFAIQQFGYFYIFTLTAQKVIRLNPITLEQKIFDFPFTNIAIVNYIDDGFIVGIWPEPKNRRKGLIVVTDKDFTNFRTINMMTQPQQISTQANWRTTYYSDMGLIHFPEEYLNKFRYREGKPLNSPSTVPTDTKKSSKKITMSLNKKSFKSVDEVGDDMLVYVADDSSATYWYDGANKKTIYKSGCVEFCKVYCMEPSCRLKRQLSKRIIVQIKPKDTDTLAKIEKSYPLKRVDLNMPKGFFVFEAEAVTTTLFFANKIYESEDVISAQPDWQPYKE